MSFWTAGAIAGSSIVGGLFGSHSSNKAANAQKQAAAQATAEQQRQYDLTRSDLKPYRETGYSSLNRLNQMLLGNSPDYSAFYKNPGYEFQRSEGTRGIQRSAAARSGAASGNVLRDLTRFSSNLAAGGFQDYRNSLMNLAGMGENAVNSTGAYGANKANNVASNYLASGDASAAGYMGSANAITGALDTGLNNYLLYRGGYFGKQPGGRNVDLWDANYSEVP